VVKGGSREEPVDVAELQEVAGLVALLPALLPALLFVDGGAASVRHGRRSWGAIGRERERESEAGDRR
jgi:hypothetical protein